MRGTLVLLMVVLFGWVGSPWAGVAAEAPAMESVATESLDIPAVPDTEGEGRVKFLMKKQRVPHCKRGPDRCETCRQNDAERWCLLDIDPPDQDKVQRPVTEVLIHGQKAFRVYDVLQTFATEEEARQFLAKGEFPGLVWER